VTGKKRDDLQEAIALLRGESLACRCSSTTSATDTGSFVRAAEPHRPRDVAVIESLGELPTAMACHGGFVLEWQ
jgi:hypothetical protein